MVSGCSLGPQSGLAISPSRIERQTRRLSRQKRGLSRQKPIKTKAEIKIKVKTSRDFVDDRYHIHTALVPLFAFCRTVYLSTCIILWEIFCNS